MPADIELVRSMVRQDALAVVATNRPNGGIQASVVSAGVLDHPVSGRPCVAFVAIGGTVKLANLRRAKGITLVLRAGHEWVAVEGQAALAGPDDDLPGFDRARVPQLLRDIFTAAGGMHNDWPTYDRVMAQEHRTGVLIEPQRIYSNRGR